LRTATVLPATYCLSLRDALPIYQGWEDDGQHGRGGEEGSPGKVVPVEDEGQRHAHQSAQKHTQHRDVQAVPQGLQVGQRLRTERSEEHTSELQSREKLVCRLPLE